MKIDRSISKETSMRVDVIFGENCLGCDGCSGMCRHLQELTSLPSAVLARGDGLRCKSERLQK